MFQIYDSCALLMLFRNVFAIYFVRSAFDRCNAFVCISCVLIQFFATSNKH